jgi:hypothetical protein
MDAVAIIIALITALLAGGGLGGLISALVARRKVPSEIRNNVADAERKEAEATDIITRAAGQVTQMMEVRICLLQKEVDELRRQVEELQVLFDTVLAGAHVLFTQVIELNGQPKYTPPERRKK